MTKKVISTIYINQELLKKAKDIGLNISKTCENALKNAIRRLEASNPHKTTKDLSVNTSSQKKLVRLPRFEPGLGAWGAPVLDQTRP